MRKHLHPLALAAAVLALTAACSSSPNEALEATDDETTVGEAAEAAGGGIPEPSDEQADELVENLAAIVPALGDEAEDTVDAARNMCSSITGGSGDEDLVRAAVIRFDDGTDRVDQDAAAEIVEIVRDAEWCE